ncbi:cytochrome c family protein [Solidesulfovibrio carbinoliphilus subsp. oakridgensis]|uniref:Cytochrome c family protein n=1 Tax=Solidesulfovibrio carbinoliphilus subsp. oakridgensis TaxID=694327 RepID=G7Q976_9BACT|nr:cytochrome ubiquinol oxidase subunit I [Solidesulfovibrio carbinoliphilus]EHJ47798.1 cytochrome c family protein [Solidesulfovibrio carbinoliphilus subsp. oakridgensis]
MDFPVWQNGAFGGGFFIALIAVLHVFVAHFAVGGGLFLVLTEAKARKAGSAPIMAYLHRHTRFFLLLTMVFGALSGVGIWFTISVLSPQATLVLIRTFVWGWATEWTFFAGEIAALLVYYYGFDRLEPARHQLVGFFYFLFAWLSLFTVNGIIGFMLTPGQWPVTLDFWDGLFNPTFLPSLVLRTAMALLLAGLFGFGTALGIRDEEARETMLRAACRWVVYAAPVLLLSGWWYVGVLPPSVRDFVLRRSTEMPALRLAYPVLLLAVAAGSLALATRLPLPVRRALAALLLLCGLGLIGTFETLREAARKPWLISGLVWSTDIRPSQAAPYDAPFLPRLKWAKVRQVTAENKLAAGHALYTAQCLACHAVGGPFKDIRNYTKHIGSEGVSAFLAGQGKLFTQMPPFLGNPAEREALAAYVAEGLNGRPPEKDEPVAVEPATVDLPAFDPDTASHLLLAFNTLGVVATAGCDGSFTLAVPGNTLTAVLVKRDVTPEVVTANVSLTYEAPDGFKHPSKRSDFWKYAKSLTGRELAPDISTTGLGPDGTMAAGDKVFAAAGIPVTPYPDTGGVNSYPVFTVTAKDAATGAVLATTRAVAPTSTEMRCFTCHGGGFAVDGTTGVAPDTARDILSVHDKRNGTDMAQRAAAGQPVACQSCHPDAGPNAGPEAKGLPELLSLSAAIHGFHANYMTGSDETACARCHPTAPTGVTQAQRDNHNAAGIGCPRCHGFMEDHALSLLAAEKAAGKTAAAWLMAPLAPRSVPDVAAIHPRAAWTQEPDCLTCHKDFTRPAKDATAFNAWTKDASGLFRNRREDTGNIPCAACHGSPHATTVAVNDYGLDVNNIPSMQYMGAPGVLGSGKRCDVCHTVPMEGGDVHHANMER